MRLWCKDLQRDELSCASILRVEIGSDATRFFHAESCFRSACISREREGASTVSINHPLTAIQMEAWRKNYA
jgi:hypothetical protein